MIAEVPKCPRLSVVCNRHTIPEAGSGEVGAGRGHVLPSPSSLLPAPRSLHLSCTYGGAHETFPGRRVPTDVHLYRAGPTQLAHERLRVGARHPESDLFDP